MLPNLDVPALGLTFHSYTTFYLLTVLFALIAGPLRVSPLVDVEARKVRRAALVVVLAAVMGARLHFVATHWPIYAANPMAIVEVWAGGRHAGGAVLAVLIAGFLVSRYYRLPVLHCLDAAMPIVCVALAIFRVGCFLHGCCVGIRCNLPWCVSFPPGTSIYEAQVDAGLLPIGASTSLTVHPLQLYFLLVALSTAALGHFLYSRRRYDGQVTLIVLVVLFAAIAPLEALRAVGRERALGGIATLAGMRFGVEGAVGAGTASGSFARVAAVLALTAFVLAETIHRLRGIEGRPKLSNAQPIDDQRT
jgi:phosphatidylglycerol:prolipoprotein diacylglycerol transferase